MADEDTLLLILDEIGGAFAPLGEALESAENFELYARELGWSVAAIPPAIQAVAQPIGTLIADLADGRLDASSAPEFINLLRAVIDAVDRIGSAPAGELPPLAGFAEEFPRQVLDRTIVDWLINDHPSLGSLLRLIGVIEIRPVAAAPGRLAYTRRRVHWEALADFLQNPAATLDAAYDWSGAFDADRFVENLKYFLGRWGIHVYGTALPDAIAEALFGAVPEGGLAAIAAQLIGDRYTSFGIAAGLYVAPTPGPPGLVVVPYANGELGARLDISEDLAFTIQGEAILQGGFAVLLHPAESIRFLTPGAGGAATDVQTAVLFGIEVKPGEEGRRVLLGTSSGSRFEIETAAVRIGGQFATERTPVVIAEAALQGGRVVIDLSGSDGFLSQILPAEGLSFDTDLTIGVNSASGLYFGGSGGLEVQLPAHVKLGPIEIQGALLALSFRDGAFLIEIGATISADLSVIKATVENIGLQAEARFVDDGAGNAGPIDLSFAFKPPNGVGLVIDAAVVKGGGYLYFDFDKGEYAGALELTIDNFLSLKAIGLITTRLPGGKPGFSLLVIITAEFDPGFQLGYGFTLLGVGGLLGLNRMMLLDPLVQGVRTGAVNSILFPTNVVENAPKILSDLRTIFPPREGTFLIGPMAKIGWGTPTLISVALGVVIEIPGNIAILGRLRVALPTEDEAVLILQVSFVGALEFDKRRIWFFATMYESRVVFITLDGEMGQLMDFSDNPAFVLSVGGFHPRFKAPPLPFPSPKRISLTLVNESWGRVRGEIYFAVTSNSIQTGCRIEAFFGYDAFSAEGHFSFDALIRFSPFYLIVELSCGFAVKVFGVGLWRVQLRGSLEGPTPWRIQGSAEISILFFSFSVDVDVTFGQRRRTILPPIAVLPRLREELEKLESWRTTPPPAGRLLVSLRDLSAAGVLVLHPVGMLQITQRFVPLNLPLDKVGNQKPSDVKQVRLAVQSGSLEVKGVTKEKFAAGQYRDMSDGAKLSAAAYEPLDSGVELGAAGRPWKTGPGAQRNVRYERIVIDTALERVAIPFFDFWAGMFDHFRVGSARARSPLSLAAERRMRPFEERVTVGDDQYTIALQADNTAYSASASFSSFAEAQAHLAEAAQANPALHDELHVIPNAELNAA